ncbi:hypothetical protein VTK73DRAFT_4284 [Phialemonium thermophilum]|uniref:Dynamin family protein n=1 Tax=Phialemonium thermophilum TaxID=223376 RepID=A0ABR3WUP9_9PEZI
MHIRNSQPAQHPKMTVYRDTVLLSDPTLLAKIDNLRDLNIGQHVPLPQLVVVGDQSSGKSSLLESLCGIPFPKAQSLCTRHATQITSRRSDEESVKITINPGPHASELHRKQLEKFRQTLPSGQNLRERFADILAEANKSMGLRAEASKGEGDIFSEDVLKVEIQGPNEDYLTVIDVPGIFRTTMEGTTKNDMAMVKELVRGYIKDDRTIILAVLPSNVDIATQEILELAEEYDKSGERTLGVLTKADLVLENRAQAAVCDLIQGRRRPLTLGYFLVRNRGPDNGDVEPSELDQIFRQSPWNDLPPGRVGIAALKEQLAVLLVEISRREFPKLLREVNDKIKECKKELAGLGPPRQDEREQRSFLSRIAEAFQHRARAALAADYQADPAFDQTELRLITNVVNITEVYSAEFRQGAHARHFEDVRPVPEDEYSESEPEEDQGQRTVQCLRKLLDEAKLDEYTPDESNELGSILVPPARPRYSWYNGTVTTWIADTYLRSRGLDLGTFNAHQVSMAFAEQSRNWGALTSVYMSRVVVTLHRFIATALRSVCPDDEARKQLWSAILDSLVERYQKAVDHAHLLIEVERHKQPYTLNQQFSEALSKARGERITELLHPKARKDTKQYGELQYMVNLDDIARAAAGKRNLDRMQEEIHDILRAYYNLALDRFVDNVFHLAVGHNLLHGPSSPLQVFTQEWVFNLEPDSLEQIVGESRATKKSRSVLTKKIDDLTKALKILKR